MSRLPPAANREVMDVSGKVAEPVHLRGRSMGDDPVTGFAFPSWYPRCELQPCGAQPQVVRLGSTSELVDAVPNATELACGANEPLPGGLWDAKLARLPARDESPLLFGHGGNTCSRSFTHNYHITPHIWGNLKWLARP